MTDPNHTDHPTKTKQHAFTPLTERLERGVSCVDNLIKILQTRIQADADFVRALEKVLDGADMCLFETGSVREALDAIHADMKNEFHAR